MNLEPGAAALAFLVGEDLWFATLLGRQPMTNQTGSDTIYSLIRMAAWQAAFSHGLLWAQEYGPTDLAYVIRGRPVRFDQYLMDENMPRLQIDGTKGGRVRLTHSGAALNVLLNEGM